jgi:hypothetical protein
MLKFFARVAALAILATSPASAQVSLDEIESQLEAGASDLDRVDELLAAEDANRRIAAMEMLLKSGNPLFIRRAQQVGLLSSDPDMQLAALKATLDGGGPLRLEVDLSKLEDDALTDWTDFLGDYGTVSVDGTAGVIVFDVAGYSDDLKCHVLTDANNYCFAHISGNNVAFVIEHWSRTRGVARLGPDGALSGELGYDGISVPLRVSLID